MSRKNIHRYFERKASEWNVLDFLNECDAEPFERKIDCYTFSLDTIADNEALKLLKKYREHKQIHVNYPSFTENTINNGTVNGGIIFAGNMSKGTKRLRVTESNKRQEESDDDFMLTIKRKNLSKNKESAGSKKFTTLRPSTPEHQIYSASVNQELLKRLNQEKQHVKSIFEPISSNIIDTTNNHYLIESLDIKRDYHL